MDSLGPFLVPRSLTFSAVAAASFLRVSHQYETSAGEDLCFIPTFQRWFTVVTMRIYWDGFTTLLSPQSHSIAADTIHEFVLSFYLFILFFPTIQIDQFSSPMLISCEIIWELQHICRTSMNLLQKPFNFLLYLIVL